MMRRLVGLLGALLVAVAPAIAGDRRRSDIDVLVPLDPSEHGELRFFDGREHHPLPGTVTINKAPYVCDVHRRSFRDRDRFVAHLRVEDGVEASEIPAGVVVVDGVAHYPGQ